MARVVDGTATRITSNSGWLNLLRVLGADRYKRCKARSAMEEPGNSATAGLLAALDAFMRDKNLHLKELFEKIDASGDGDVSPKELHIMLSQIGFSATPADCLALVKHLDYSGDGNLSIDELETALQQYHDFQESAATGDDTRMRQLLDAGVDINQHLDPEGNTALRRAAQNGHYNLVKLLLERGADVNHVNSYGWTVLHYCCAHGAVHMSQLLIQHGADLEARDKKEATPMMLARCCALALDNAILKLAGPRDPQKPLTALDI